MEKKKGKSIFPNIPIGYGTVEYDGWDSFMFF